MPKFHVEFVYDDPYDNPVASFDWTLEQLADTIRIDQMQWNPDFRAFDQSQPLFIDEYEDVKGNWIHVETFVTHQDGSRLTGDELEQIAMAARGDLPITMKQQRLPLGAGTTKPNSTDQEIPTMRTRNPRNRFDRIRHRVAARRATRTEEHATTNRSAAWSHCPGCPGHRGETMKNDIIRIDDITLIEEYGRDEYHLYGLWAVGGVEIAAVIGVPEYLRGTAQAAGSWAGLVTAWWGDPTGSDQGSLDDETAEAALGELIEHAAGLFDREVVDDMMTMEEIYELLEDRGISPTDFWALAMGGDRGDMPREDVEWCIRKMGAAAQNRSAAIEPADVLLLQNAVKQLAKMESADHAVRMLRDIIDAAEELKSELGG